MPCAPVGVGYCAPNRRTESVGAATRSKTPLQEDAEVFVEEDVGVGPDRAPPHFPRAVDLAQHVVAATGEELVIRLQVRAAHQKRGLGLYLAVLQRRRFEIADQVT